MLTMNQTAIDRMERFYNKYMDNSNAEYDFTKEIANYVKSDDFPIKEMEFSFRTGEEKDTVYKINLENEKVNGIQNKAKNEKAWRIFLVIAEMYRTVKAGEGVFRNQDTGDAWYFTDNHLPIGTYMVPFAVLSFVMDAVKEEWEAKEIVSIDRGKKAKEDKSGENTEESSDEMIDDEDENEDEDEDEDEDEEDDDENEDDYDDRRDMDDEEDDDLRLRRRTQQ